MNVFVMALVAFLLGVAARACWMMAFPLSFPLGDPASAMTLTELTFRTLASMLWTGVLAATATAGVAYTAMLLQWFKQRKNDRLHPFGQRASKG